jgi:HB1, ASXL, restriction endonuclease HTH domain
MTFLEAAEAVLRSAKRPMSAREITELALHRGLLDSHGKTPEATMSATLYGAPKWPDPPRVRAWTPTCSPRLGSLDLRGAGSIAIRVWNGCSPRRVDGPANCRPSDFVAWTVPSAGPGKRRQAERGGVGVTLKVGPCPLARVMIGPLSANTNPRQRDDVHAQPDAPFW